MSRNISLIFGGLTIKPLFRNLFLIGPNRESHILDFSTHRHQISPGTLPSYPGLRLAQWILVVLNLFYKKCVPKNPISQTSALTDIRLVPGTLQSYPGLRLAQGILVVLNLLYQNLKKSGCLKTQQMVPLIEKLFQIWHL